ncbi:YicC/YloC family endoribonuclease [Congregibacter variabilis]|uniref:YicC/YloC family endoribonuclease n=1 Tax=Congregibacter variabilis TaxID=3081200 RepID=A0ABZ0HYU1_9GAMM|nr:YicC/YloC family endoribonuclease [Congregibacter sp. IMCC43200]
MTLHSMTAFARETASAPTTLVVELRSVNHRYLDCHFKLPDSLRALEPKLRDGLAKTLKRGKLDCHIRVVDAANKDSLEVNPERLASLLKALDQIRAQTADASAPNTLELLQFPGVCQAQELEESTVQQAAFRVFESALQNLQESRAREGLHLEEFLRRRLAGIGKEVEALRLALPALRNRQEERLRKRLDELEQPLDEGRIEQELVMLLQKADVEEELDRLEAHIDETTRILDKGGPCGRRLDFLMQELNREANTLSSKATTSSTTQSAVELKVLIEQMREQVQNIE